MNRILRSAIVLTVLVLPVAACGGDESVGDASVLEFDQEDSAAFGATTTAPTSVAPTETTTPAAAQAEATTTTIAVQQTTTTLPPEKQEVSIEIRILDTSPYFDPSQSAVPVGGKLRFVNAGTATFSVVSDVGAFDSGPIAPGAVWIYDATTPGRYNYSDGSRPFAVGAFEVVG